MNKTIEQLCEEIRNSEELSTELNSIFEQRDREKLADWIKEQGCDATLEEAKAFLLEKGKELQESGELTPEELEMVVGGTDISVACTALWTFSIGSAVVIGEVEVHCC